MMIPSHYFKFVVFILVVLNTLSFRYRAPQKIKIAVWMGEGTAIMVNGMPGPMAVETAKACLDRGYQLINVGFTGPSRKFSSIHVQGKTLSAEVELITGPGISDSAEKRLLQLKKEYPNMIIIDYTHPTATLENLVEDQYKILS